MIVIKPTSLGVLHRPYRHRGRHHFVVVAIGFFRLGEDVARFLPEHEQWPIALSQLPSGEVLDAAMPKGHAEVLLAGSAYAPGAEPVARMTMRLAVGPIDKHLCAVGDREWLYGLMPFYQVTPPAPFRVMPITDERAYGGPNYADNPQGSGYIGRRAAALVGENRGRMPNIEYADEPVRSNRRRYTPAGFGPIDIRRPVRARKAGTYDQKWIAHDFPGLADDVDWTLFNAAPADQQFDGDFAGGAPYRLEGMHPELPAIEGRLPDMHTRAFVQRVGQPVDGCEELALRFDTVWFFPDRRLGAALYRGETIINDSDALDVNGVMLAYKHAADAPRERAHYIDAFATRTDPATAALHILNEAPLTPAISPAEHAATAARRAQAEALELAQQQAALDEATAEFWKNSGMTPPPDYAPPKAEPSPLPALTADAVARGEVDLAQVVATAQDLAAAARERADAERARLERDVPAGVAEPPSAAAQIAQVQARAEKVAHDLLGDAEAAQSAVAALWPGIDFAALSDAERNQLWQAAAEMPALQRRARRVSPTAPATAALAPEAALHLGRQVRAWHTAGVVLAGRDLAGASLRGADFSGADLREVMFEQADLNGAVFRSADLRGAVFTGARLDGADFTGANLVEANLTSVCARAARFRDAELRGAMASELDGSGADFTGAKLRGLVAIQARLNDAVFDEADLTEAMLQDAVAYGAHFQRARFERAVLVGARLGAADFRGARFERSALLNVFADRSDWRGARFVRVQTGGSASFTGADLRDVRAEICGFRGTDLSGADFGGGCFAQCDFGGCRFADAVLDGATWWRSVFMQASFIGCHIHRADFFQALCRKADFRGAHLEQVNFVQADLTEALFGDAPTADAA